MKKRDELRNKELLQAIEHSSRSFEEIMDFLGTDDFQDWKSSRVNFSGSSQTQRVHQYLLDKHYFRKHGANAYYGQGSEDH